MSTRKPLSHNDKIKAIAFQNDAFRSEIGSNKSYYSGIKGKCVINADTYFMPDEVFNEIIYRVRDFNGFDKYNDPLGEHKKGRFYYSALDKDVIWEIHYYSDGSNDKTPSEEPSNTTRTYRDLRISFAPRLK